MSNNSQIPMQMEVKIYPQHLGSNVLASASVTLNGCFAIRGVRVIDGRDGVFASMPSYKTRDGYKDVCFPCTKEFHQQFNNVVVDAYRQALAQQQDAVPQELETAQEEQALQEKQPPLEEQASPELEEPPVPQMTM